MQAFHSDRFEPDLPAGHRFPMQKYRLLREAVQREWPDVRVCEAPSVPVEVLRRVHAAAYVEAVLEGRLSPAEVREIGFPWSPSLVERSLRSVGGTVAATSAALQEGVAVNLAGGTHHATAGQGGGFCVFNDVAVAAREAQSRWGVTRCAVIDLDVHQGNGTAAIFKADPSVFTLSLHGERNFPFRKVMGSLDVGLPDGCNDTDYLHALESALAQLTQAHRQQAFELVFYLAGADPHEGDRLGRMALTAAGMRSRDERVMQWCEGQGHLPMVMCMAGGYGRDLAAMLDVQLQSLRSARDSWQRRGAVRHFAE